MGQETEGQVYFYQTSGSGPGRDDYLTPEAVGALNPFLACHPVSAVLKSTSLSSILCPQQHTGYM